MCFPDLALFNYHKNPVMYMLVFTFYKYTQKCLVTLGLPSWVVTKVGDEDSFYIQSLPLTHYPVHASSNKPCIFSSESDSPCLIHASLMWRHKTGKGGRTSYCAWAAWVLLVQQSSNFIFTVCIFLLMHYGWQCFPRGLLHPVTRRAPGAG